MSFSIKAQNKTLINSQQTANLINSWYESPKESFGDTIMFRPTKYVKITGVDSQAFEFAKLVFNNNTEFRAEYWRWCKEGNYEYTGAWGIKSGNVVLNFGVNKCKVEMQLLSATKNELKVIIKEVTN